MAKRLTGRAVRRLLAVAAVITLSTGIVATPALGAPGPSTAPEWWFDAWQVPSLWSAGADGRGITVAIIDTGVQANIPELEGKVVAGADFIGNGTDGRTDFDGEQFSHGTAMASLVVASKGYGDIEGMAPAAKILPIAVPLRGVIRTGGTPKLNATPAAVRYAADHGAKIISMSLGGFVYEGEDNQPCPTELQSAVLYALKKGALVVAASGNSGSDGSPVEEPGVCLGVVSVGAVDSASKVTDFSSRHPYLSVTAPGDEIPTLSKVAARAFIGGGTSQATAITSAALAMIWSKYPTATNEQVLSRLLSTATDAGPKGKDPQYGVGVINPNAAINEVAPPAQQNLVFAGVQPLLALGSAKPGTPAARPVAGSASAQIGAVSISAPGSPLGAMFYALAAISVLLLGIAVILLVVAVRRKPRPLTGYGF